MTEKELIKWAKNNLQEVQSSKNSKSSSYEKIEKKLQKNLVD